MSQQEEFDLAMLAIYIRARDECGYFANRYFQMLTENRGLRTAQILLNSAQVSEGYTALWQKGRLDLTVEALVLKNLWQGLFTEIELNVARKRLRDYGFDLSTIA